MSASRNLSLPRGWLLAWWRDEPFMLLTLGKSGYYGARFTGLMFQNPPVWKVRMLGVMSHSDAPEPIERSIASGGKQR